VDLIFLDLEATGVNPDKDRILEIGAFICNDNLDVIDTFQSPVYCRSDILAEMDDWCKETHARTGLLDLIPDAPSTWAVEQQFIAWLKLHGIEPKKGKLVGYSIHYDRALIAKRMVDLDKYLSHRMVDASTMRNLMRRWEIASTPQQDMPHRALPDCYIALEELRYYKKVLKNDP